MMDRVQTAATEEDDELEAASTPLLQREVATDLTESKVDYTKKGELAMETGILGG